MHGVKKPLTNILHEIYPQYKSRSSYLKSMLITPKIDIQKLKSSLEDISNVIDNLDLLSSNEEVFYNDGLSSTHNLVFIKEQARNK